MLLIVLLFISLSQASVATDTLSSVRHALFSPEPSPIVSPYSSLAADNAERTLTIAIVTDSFGPINSGHGMASLYASVADLLHRRGHSVHVLLTGHRLAEYDKYSFPFPVSWVPFSEYLHGGASLTTSSSVYDYLRKSTIDFDVIAFPDWNAPGYLSMQAKRAGLHFQDTTLMLGIHGGHQWTNQELPPSSTYESLVGEFMERESVLLADVVWTQSSDILTFLSSKGWKWPSSPIHQLSLPAGPAVVDAWQPKSLSPWSFDELVYFGVMKRSKGIDLFVDALSHGTFKFSKVTFMGAPGNQSVVSDIRRRLESRFQLEFLVDKDRDDALRYLVNPNRLTVIPSLYDNAPNTVYESLYLNIPMIASRATGVPSALFGPNQLFDPTASSLQRKLEELQVFPGPQEPLRAATVERAWLSFFEKSAVPKRAPSKERPTVSVIIPTYNRAQLLRECVASVESQTYENVKVIVVDDGSTDAEVFEVLDQLEQRGHTVIRQSNQYLGAARNAGAKHATGKFVLFLDDDNLALPEMVATQVTALLASGAQIAVNGHSIWDSGNAQDDTTLWLPVGPAPLAGLLGNPFGNANFMISRAAFEELGGFTTDREGWEDYEFHAKAVLAGATYAVIPESLMLYRMHDRQLQMAFSSDTTRGYERVLRAYSSILQTAGVPLKTMVDVRSTKRQTTDPCQDVTVRAVVCGDTVTFPVSVTTAPARKRRVRQLGYTFAPTPAPTTKAPVIVNPLPGNGQPPVVRNPNSFLNSDGSTTTTFVLEPITAPPEGTFDLSFEFPCEGAGCTPTVCSTTYTFTERQCCCYTDRTPGSTCTPNYNANECMAGVGVCDRADFNGDGVVDIIDLAENLVRWNFCECPVPDCQFDFDYNGDIDIADLANLLNAWGPALYKPFLCCCVLDPVSQDCYNVPQALCLVESSNTGRKRRTFFGCRADLPLM